MRYLSSFIGLFLALALNSQAQRIDRVDPPNWYVGMENGKLELLVSASASMNGKWEVEGDGVMLLSQIYPSNTSYVYLKIHIDSDAPEQSLRFRLNGKKKFDYVLKSKRSEPKGLHPNDVMYLITPDRFANGDVKNDVKSGMNESIADRADPYGRHGGDLRGILNHIDYLDALGVSALWLNPVLENDEPEESYHGYAITDHYLVDPRFGTNELYRELVDSMHARDMKMVLDVIYNHFGDEHYLIQNLPDSNWVNWWPNYTKTTYRAPILNDPHAAPSDQKVFSDGWFDHHMPDMNQRDEHVSAYLIQNSLWWIEEYQIDAFRIDTYTYPDQEFMAKLNRRIRLEYPSIFLFGETWVHGHQVQAFHLDENQKNPNFPSGLHSVTDFQLYFAIEKMMRESNGWTEGIYRLYYALSADWLYRSPDSLVTFVDNHDIARFYGLVGQDMRKFKMGLGFLMTTRGIPCVYYGTEVLMSATSGHGEIREDFPGGWDEDGLIWADSLNAEIKDFQAWFRELIHYRRNSCALGMGELIQYVPRDDVYVFLRSFGDERIAVVINYSEESKEIDLMDYPEIIDSKTKATSVVFESKEYMLNQSIQLEAMGMLILGLE